MRSTKRLTCLGFLLIFVAAIVPMAQSEEGVTVGEDLWLTTADFAAGSHDGTMVTPAGLTLAEDALTGQYTSPILTAPIPFNVLFSQWTADIPGTTSLAIQVRTRPAAGSWSNWMALWEYDDWTMSGDPDVVGDMVAVSAADGRHDEAQVVVSLSRYLGESAPVLESLQFTFVDSTAGPTAEELVAQQHALTPPTTPGDGYPKPLVVSRQVWCTDPGCSCTTDCDPCIADDPLAYEPVTHLIFHHTVSNNDEPDWAAIVRAIYYFHTYTRCWGDIGYNYLVDWNGVLYEGHRGGDDVIGTHAADANAGTMALSFIGTFTDVTPPATMQNAAADLFAWKADQKDIDVYDASYLPNMDWGLPHLMGHRDVYGTTECPGGAAFDLKPWLRDEVAQRIGFTTPYLYVDELSSAFTKSNANWYDGPSACGYDVHAYYTYSTTDPNQAVNWADWRPEISVAGNYEVWAYVPFCATGDEESDGATYTINHAYGATTVVVSHQANLGLWINLGQYYFNAGNGGYIHLTDLTTTDSGKGIWFDALRLRYLDSVPPNAVVVNEAPAAGAWLRNRTVVFNWETENVVSFSSGTLTVATDAGLTNVVANPALTSGQETAAVTFSQDYAQLYWRVSLVTPYGTITSAVTSFGLDSVAPISSVNNVFQLTGGRYVPTWSGSDATSGVATYNVDYRLSTATTWTTWLVNTSATSASFTPPTPGATYCFRSQATDAAGNVETAHGSADRCTDAAIFLSYNSFYPLISR